MYRNRILSTSSPIKKQQRPYLEALLTLTPTKAIQVTNTNQSTKLTQQLRDRGIDINPIVPIEDIKKTTTKFVLQPPIESFKNSPVKIEQLKSYIEQAPCSQLDYMSPYFNPVSDEKRLPRSKAFYILPNRIPMKQIQEAITHRAPPKQETSSPNNKEIKEIQNEIQKLFKEDRQLLSKLIHNCNRRVNLQKQIDDFVEDNHTRPNSKERQKKSLEQVKKTKINLDLLRPLFAHRAMVPHNDFYYES